MKPWEIDYNGSAAQQIEVDAASKPWERDWGQEQDFSSAKPHQIFSIDGSNTDASTRLNAAVKSFHKNKKLHDVAVFGDSISKSVVRGIYETVGGLGSFINWYGDNMILPDDFMGLDKETIYRLNTFGRGWQKAGAALRKGADFVLNDEGLKLDEEVFSGDFVDNPSFTRTAAAFASAAPSLMSMAGLFKLTGSAGLAYFVMGGIDSADIYEASKEAGQDLETTNLLYSSAMGGTALIDRFLSPVENILGKKSLGKSVARKIADHISGGLLEATGEGSQTLWQNAVEKYGIDDTKNLLEGVIESAIGGFGAGAFATGAFDRANKKLLDKGASQEEVNALVDAAGMFAQKHPDEINNIAFQHLNQGLSNFEKFIEEHKGTPEAAAAMQKKADLETVGKMAYDNLIKAGQSEKVAKAQSQIIQGISLWGAEETGLSPVEYINQRFPQIKQQKFAEFRQQFAETKKNAEANNIDLFEALVNPETYRKVEKSEQGKKGDSLLAFLKKRGGLKDAGGELKAMDAGKQYIGLINNKSGNNFDDMALSAWENGYFPNNIERPDIQELLDAINDELFGKKRYAYQDGENHSFVDDINSLAEQMDMLGIDYSKMSAREAEKAYNEAVDNYNSKTEDNQSATQEWDDIPFQTQIVDETNDVEPISQETIRQFSNEAKKFFKDIQQGKKEKKTIGFGKVKNWLADTSRRFNLNIDGFKHIVDLGGFIHIDIRHGKETKLGQSDITEEDVAKIPEIVSQPNYLVYGIKSGRGLKTIGYIKQFPDGATYYVEEVWGKEKELAAKTMYIKEGGEAADEIISSLIHTSETTPSTATIVPVVPINITQSGENVKGKPNFQGKDSRPNGAFYDNVIYLFEKANSSTFMHETAHWFRNELKSFNSDKSRALLDKVNKWENEEFARRYKVDLHNGRYVVRDNLGNIIYDQNFQSKEQAQEYAQNELFARGFETYLKEGKSPNSYMKQAFKSFWNWLRHLYRSAKSLNVDLNDDIKAVYSDIIGGEDIDFYMNAPSDDVIKRRAELEQEREKELDNVISRAVSGNKGVHQNVFMNFVAERTESKKDFVKWWNQTLVPISTRAARVNQGLKNKLRAYDYRLNQKLNERLETIKPFLDIWAKFSNDDAVAFDLALKNQYVKKQDEILKKYNATEQFEVVKSLLESLYNEASDVRVEMGYKADYFPRQVADVDGLMTYLHGSEMASDLRRAEKEAGFENMTPEEQSDFINKFLRGYNRKDTTAPLPSNIKQRRIDIVTPELNIYYKPSVQALTNYIERMSAAIESRKFWGFDAENIDDSIGAFVDEMIEAGEIKPEQDKEVEAILRARFKAKGVSNKNLLMHKNLAYLYTMGGINSAITQIDDVSVALYKAGFWNTANSILHKNRGGLSREELGLSKIGQEFMEASTSSKAVDKVFKLTGLDAIDGFGKNVLINATFDKFQNMAKTNENELRSRIEPIMEQETEQTIEDIKNGEISDNVKLLMFNELADMQPISLSEMPEWYLTSGNGRVFYMLKTFMLKRIDIFRNECFDKIRNGQTKEGIQNLFRLASLMVLCGSAKDAIIDLMFGRKTDISDMFVNNVLGLFGFTKYQLYKARDEGFEGLASSFIPPLFAFFGDLGRDISKKFFSKNGKDIKDFEIWKGIPIVGRFYYWWLGGGHAKEQRKNKKEKKLK